MFIEFTKPAENEFIDVVEYYNGEREGLGFDFAVEVRKTLERIVQHPKAWTILSDRTRRCRMNRFPYGIIYQIRPDKILIIAIMHFHRHPEAWKSRLNS